MDGLSKLGSFLLFSSVIFQETLHCDALVTMNVTVSGYYVVKTGIRTYTISTSAGYYSDVVILCSSQTHVPATISLMKSGGQLITKGGVFRDGITFIRKRMGQVSGIYHCVLNVSTWISNDSYSEVFVSSEVEIRKESTSPLCASNIGNVGYVGESVTLKCVTSYFYDCYYWGNTRKKVLEALVTENFPGKVCKCPQIYTNKEPCSLPMSVLRSIYFNISVTVNDIYSNTNSVMEFYCNSTPPRLMYWKVFGSHGNILDLDNIGQNLNVNTTVNITQLPGETSLRISETVPGGNGIHTVMCFTYDTEKRIVAFRRIQTTSECSSNCEKSFLEPTDIQTTTFDNRTTTVESTTLVMTTTEGDSNDDELASIEQGCEMKTATINNYLLIGFVSLPYLVIILILIGIICYMNYKNRKKTELSTDVSAHYTPPETVLHDNPVYLAFSETKNCSPDNENEEKEITYANL